MKDEMLGSGPGREQTKEGGRQEGSENGQPLSWRLITEEPQVPGPAAQGKPGRWEVLRCLSEEELHLGG